jgi:streptogramin lyase
VSTKARRLWGLCLIASVVGACGTQNPLSPGSPGGAGPADASGLAGATAAGASGAAGATAAGASGAAGATAVDASGAAGATAVDASNPVTPSATAKPFEAGPPIVYATSDFVDFAIPHDAQDIVAGADGNLWFTETLANRIGRMSVDGHGVEFVIPTAGSGPASLTRGRDGNIWFTEHDAAKIGRITPDGVITEFPAVPNAWDIAADSEGNLWVTHDDLSTAPMGSVARISTNGHIDTFAVHAGAVNITPDAAGGIWFLYASYGYGISHIDGAGSTTDFDLPGCLCFSNDNDLVAGPDGNLWVTGNGMTSAGVFQVTPMGGIQHFPTPYGVMLGNLVPTPDGHLWTTGGTYMFTGLLRLTTGGDLSQFPTPAPGAVPGAMTLGPDGNLWFTYKNLTRLGRMHL